MIQIRQGQPSAIGVDRRMADGIDAAVVCVQLMGSTMLANMNHHAQWITGEEMVLRVGWYRLHSDRGTPDVNADQYSFLSHWWYPG